ncbi:serine hydrolase domain-containing protein [Lacticaseibacillus saniviri]|uniref:serine hydrolase domain-containing protein n=1 Tax=Lacticaseibacillus saniviri TaxID=931533 RepID=UPI001EDF99BF|nr:serine hydrolase [Lacticaseibacillus saniviri]MCG4282480.1 serine hydrolase [Lacticaseibacillus saniviri]
MKRLLRYHRVWWWLLAIVAVSCLAWLLLLPRTSEDDRIPITINYSPGYGIKVYNKQGVGTDALIATNTHLTATRLTTINGIAMYQIGANRYIPKSLTQIGRGQAKNVSQAEDDLVAETHFQGTIATIQHNKISSVRSYGYQNAGDKIKNSANTMYPIASAEKMMTAVLIAQLIQKGQLSYDTKLSQFYPKVDGADKITVRQLLDHRSGIQMNETYPDTPLKTEQDAINWTLNHLDTSDDYGYSYTNANFVLLSGIVRQVTKQSYMQVLKARILTPLKLQQSKNYDQLTSRDAVAQGYQYEDGHDNQPQPISQGLLSSLPGTGSLYMSAADMARFQIALNTNSLLPQAAFKKLLTMTVEPEADESAYAGGWFLGDGYRMVHGSYNDFAWSFDSIIEMKSTGGSGIVLLANQSTDTDTQQLAENILKIGG